MPSYFDLLKPLTDFSVREVCPDKLSRQPLCKDYSRLHLKELKQNYWPSPSSSLWQLDETTHLDCVTTLASSMGRSNQKHISTMPNTSNASQSATMANQFQAWQTQMEKKQEEDERRTQSLL